MLAGGGFIPANPGFSFARRECFLKFGPVESSMNPGRAALIIAHPGRELRVHHWLETARPLVLVLTDGCGRTGQSRLASPTHTRQQVGAVPGPLYGRLGDAAIYGAILPEREEAFLSLLEEIADEMITAKIDLVAGDALEGCNSSHDRCRHLIGSAVEHKPAEKMLRWSERRNPS